MDTADLAGSASVRDVVAIVAAGGTDQDVLAALSVGAPAMIGEDLIHRLVPYAERLRTIDYRDHPWAALCAGVAIAALDRCAGRTVLSRARIQFAEAGDHTGEGWGCFLEGLEDLGEGQLARAERWWARARQLLGDAGAVCQFSAVHQSLAAYGRGDLRSASRIAEVALDGARRQRDTRTELIAAAYLSLFRWWTGDFHAVEQTAGMALATAGEIRDPRDRYEVPLLYAALGAVAYARHDVSSGDAHLERGLTLASEQHNEWYGAILRTVRAVVGAPADPVRSLADAGHALSYYERIGEQWWSRWALEAFVIAQRHVGDLEASVAAGRRLLELVDNPLERGRAMLEVACTLSLLDARDEAAELLDASLGLLDQAGAQFLLARAELQLAHCRAGRTEYLLRSARRRASANADDPAWRHLLHGAPITVQILGQPLVRVGGRVVNFGTRREMEVVAILAVAGPDGIHVERLCDMLWPDADTLRSSHRLDVLLSSLRSAMLPATRLVKHGKIVSLELDEDECDYRIAVSLCRRLASGGGGDADRAMELLRRPLLGGQATEWIVEAQHSLDAMAAKIGGSPAGEPA